MAMTTYAIVRDGVVTYVDAVEADQNIADLRAPHYVAELVPCPPDVEAGWIVAGGEFHPPPAPAVDLVAYAADRRWRAETAGIVVAGAAIATDRESQALIMGARLYAQATPAATFQFKTAGGFVSLDAAQIEAVALAVAAHVQACFAVEAAVLAEIEAGNITTLSQVDGAAWPDGGPQNGE